MPVVRRVLFAVGVLWLAVTLAFVALRLLPGDAISGNMIGSGATTADIDRFREQLGLDRSPWLQYVHYLAMLFQGDLGVSLLSGQPVAELIEQQLRPTIVLATSSLAIAILLGLALGIAAGADAWGPLTWLADFLMNLSLSAPIFWTGTLVIYVFTVELRLLPSGGAERLSQLVLPSLLLGFHTAGPIARVVQANVRDARGAGFVWAARARGLRDRDILVRHVLRVGLVPVVTMVSLQAGFLLSGVVITETLFVRPGIGRLLLNSTLRQDYPVVQGIVILAAVVYIGLNTLTDILYRWLDPRLQS